MDVINSKYLTFNYGLDNDDFQERFDEQEDDTPTKIEMLLSDIRKTHMDLL